MKLALESLIFKSNTVMWLHGKIATACGNLLEVAPRSPVKLEHFPAHRQRRPRLS